MKEKLKDYINQYMVEYNKFMMSDFATLEHSRMKACKASIGSSLDDYINTTYNNEKFQSLLFNHIDSRNLKDSDVYNKVNIDRRLFSKIRSDINYHPSKDTVILLGVSLELNESELEELLNSASYSLPKNNHFDLIIRFCFINKIYDVFEINEMLEEYNCKLLNC